jgi:2-polyprenyl-3-methyl-5-hydroxy-6-metoxy-1,4-benzoquinol methylase
MESSTAENFQRHVAFGSFGVLDAYRAAREGRGFDFCLALCKQAVDEQPVEFDGKVVVDIACGKRNHFFSHRMSRAARIIGIDINTESIRQNKVIHEGIVGDLHAIPLADSSVDVIVSVDTIEHAENPEAFLRECRRVLRSGGRACFTTPYKYGYKTIIAHFGGKRLFDGIWLTFKGTTLPYDSLYRANSYSAVRKLAREIGFEVVSVTPAAEISHFLYPYPVLYATSRSWDKILEALHLQRFWNYMAYTLEKR